MPRMFFERMPWVFCMLSFKTTFSLSSFTFIKRLHNSSSLSAIRVVSSAYLRLLIFLPAILIPVCASSSPAFHIMYSAYGASLVSQLVKNFLAVWETWVQSLGRKDPLENSCPLQYSGLENSMDYTVTKSQTQLSNFHFHFQSAYNLNKQDGIIQPDVLLSQFGTSPLFPVQF